MNMDIVDPIESTSEEEMDKEISPSAPKRRRVSEKGTGGLLGNTPDTNTNDLRSFVTRSMGKAFGTALTEYGLLAMKSVTELNIAENSVTSIKSQLSTLANQNKSLSAALEQLDESHGQLKAKIMEVEKAKEDLKAQLNVVTKERDEQAAVIETLLGDRTSLSGKVGRLEKENQDLSALIESSNTALAAKKELLKKTTRKVIALQLRNAKLKSDVSHLESIKVELDRVNTEHLRAVNAKNSSKLIVASYEERIQNLYDALEAGGASSFPSFDVMFKHFHLPFTKKEM